MCTAGLRDQRRHRRAELSIEQGGERRTSPTATSTAGARRRRFVTGRNSAKVGYIGQFIVNHFPNSILNDTWITYSLQQRHSVHRSRRRPDRRWFNTHLRTDAFYVQDQWTRRRLTLSGAIRYDHTSGFFPEQQIGPNPFIPVADGDPGAGRHVVLTTSRRAWAWPTTCSATARRRSRSTSASTWPRPTAARSPASLTNPLNRITLSSGARTWTDANSNFRVDCDLTQHAGAGSPRRRAATSAAARQSRRSARRPPSPPPTIPRFSTDGASGRTTGTSACRCSSSCCRACRSTSATSAASFGNFFVTDNLRLRADRLRQRSASPRRSTRGCRTAAAHVIPNLYNVTPAQFGRPTTSSAERRQLRRRRREALERRRDQFHGARPATA